MFNNKKDPLVDSVKTVMAENAKRRDAESRVNEAFGVTSKRGLPHELHAKYDAALEKATKIALSEGVEALNEVSKKKVFDALERAYDPDDDDPKRIATGDRIADKASKKWGKKVGEKLRTKAIDSHYPTNEETELEEGKIVDTAKSLGKKIAVNTYKRRKFVAAQNEPGDSADKHAERIKHVQSLAKEETVPQIKESFERFLRNKFLKD